VVENVDVLVVGGGPGGSTISTFLAEKGYRVVVLEKDAHPKFHIGESLLPCNLPVLAALGVLPEVRKMGVLKLGADFSYATDDVHRTYYFSKALNATAPHAYEVRRSDFDELLFRNAAKKGVDTREHVRVTSIEHDDDRAPRAATVDAVASGPDGEVPLRFKARYVVDASGRDTFFAKKLGIKRKNPNHGSAAIFGHFQGVARRAGADQGNISIYWFDHGWMWMIPLRDDVMSVGAVCWPDYLKTRTGSTTDFLLQTLALAPAAHARMKSAVPLGEIRATGNYSYTSDRMTGPGFVMVGDAFAFIDPVFSSGVYLAMNSARLAAEVVDGALRDPASEERLQSEFEARVRKGIGAFSWFIYRFTTPAMRWIFKHPKNVFRLEEAVISMLAGDVFDSEAVHRRFSMLRFIYGVRTVIEFKDHVANKALRRKNARTVFDGVTTPEGQPGTVGFS
jgi:flavin-dependent dehydrogenase